MLYCSKLEMCKKYPTYLAYTDESSEVRNPLVHRCLQLVDFIFLQLSTELKTTLENTENESLTPISEVVNETLAPGMGTAPLRLPRIPFLYGEAKAAPGIAPGLPVLNFELAKEVPSSPKTKIPYSDGLGDIPSPPRFARMGELYPEVWNMTCVEYLNYFKSLVPSSALSMGLGDCTGKSNTDRRIESEQVTVLEDNKPHSSCYESSTFNGTNHCKESADFYRTKTRYSNEIGGNDEYKSNPVENHSSHSNSRSIFNRDSLFFAKLQDHLVSEMAKRIQNLSARDIGKVHGRFLQSQKPPGSNPLKSCLKHQEVVHNKQVKYISHCNPQPLHRFILFMPLQLKSTDCFSCSVRTTISHLLINQENNKQVMVTMEIIHQLFPHQYLERRTTTWAATTHQCHTAHIIMGFQMALFPKVRAPGHWEKQFIAILTLKHPTALDHLMDN